MESAGKFGQGKIDQLRGFALIQMLGQKLAGGGGVEYLRAIKGRDERPETPTLQQAIASLTTTQPAK